MKPDATSLDRLNDIVEPTPVPVWPPAPGWYVVIVIAATTFAWIALRWWAYRKANAYRREALKELESLNNSSAIAQLLRRTALAAHPRSEIAALAGESWTAWLSEQCQTEMSSKVSETLVLGIYRNQQETNLAELKKYATDWITHHKCNEKGGALC